MELTKNLFNSTVIVAALGYFVDIYDLLLFGMVRTASLISLGLTDKSIIEQTGLMLDNWQMAGMLIGGIVWGIIGDKRGRLSVLFGSILTYSLANLANAHVSDIQTYAILRFIAGFGLAGELGAGITLVSEAMDKDRRGLGTTLVATIGVFGAVVGGFVVRWVGVENWRTCYIIGGCMGLSLLVLRISVVESSMFHAAKQTQVKKGDFRILFTKKERWIKYLAVTLIGIPIWYVIQLYAKYSPELADSLGLVMDKKLTATNSIMLAYLGLTLGDFSSGILSQIQKSRKKTIFIFMCMTIAFVALFWAIGGINPIVFYLCIFLLGYGVGYWALFVSTAAESFGVNIRSTVTNTAPNFVRGAVILINMLYLFFKFNMGLGTMKANLLVGTIFFTLAFWAWTQLSETFGKDLNYEED